MSKTIKIAEPNNEEKARVDEGRSGSAQNVDCGTLDNATFRYAYVHARTDAHQMIR